MHIRILIFMWGSILYISININIESIDSLGSIRPSLIWVSSGLSQEYKHTHFTQLIMHRANYTITTSMD